MCVPHEKNILVERVVPWLSARRRGGLRHEGDVKWNKSSSSRRTEGEEEGSLGFSSIMYKSRRNLHFQSLFFPRLFLPTLAKEE